MRQIELSVFGVDELRPKARGIAVVKYREDMHENGIVNDLTEKFLIDTIYRMLKRGRILPVGDFKVSFALNHERHHLRYDTVALSGVFCWRHIEFRISSNENQYFRLCPNLGNIGIIYEEDEDPKLLKKFEGKIIVIMEKARKQGYDFVRNLIEDETIIEDMREEEIEFFADGELYEKTALGGA